MKVYAVYVPEIYLSRMLVEANSPEHARQIVSQGDGEETTCEFEVTQDVEPSEWKVEETDVPVEE